MLNFIFWAIWNSFLVILAWWLAIFLRKNYFKKWSELKSREKIHFLILFFLWSAFFPNIPYLFTEGRHLIDVCELENSRDILVCMKNSGWSTLFYAYSSLAIIPFVDSLERISQLLGKIFAGFPPLAPSPSRRGRGVRFVSKLFPIIFIPISALGVQIGLVGRFNSWDIFNIKKLWEFISSQPFIFQDWLITTFGLYVVFYVVVILRDRFWLKISRDFYKK